MENEYETASRTGSQKKLWFIGVALLAVIIAVAAIFVVNRDDGAGTSAAPNYVDNSGQQEKKMEAAPGDPRGVEGMSISINGDTAPVDPIQLTTTDSLIPPHDVQRLGWYSASAIPGEPGPVGSSVITGHINFAGQGQGYAYKFTEMSAGEEFSIHLNGEEKKFRITEAPYRLEKGQDLPEVINDVSGDNRVVLVTCGGKFVGGTLGYEDNIISVAEPV